jgi:hypothetical protein
MPSTTIQSRYYSDRDLQEGSFEFRTEISSFNVYSSSGCRMEEGVEAGQDHLLPHYSFYQIIEAVR